MNKKSVLLAILISGILLILSMSLLRSLPNINDIGKDDNLKMAQEIRRLNTTTKIYKYLNDMEKIKNYKDTFNVLYQVLNILSTLGVILNIFFIAILLVISSSGELTE